MTKPFEAPEYTLQHIGDEGQPVVVIDNYAADFSELCRQAANAEFGPGGEHYPGERAPAPASYLGQRSELLKTILIDVFGLYHGAKLVECNFSIVTRSPSDLTVIQSLPHFDGTDEKRLALLHYCNDASRGGTSFYRHRATGFETITDARLQVYTDALQSDVQKMGLPRTGYFSGTNQQFERIGQIQAKPNRMIIYRGIVLHSGDIPQAPRPGEGFSDMRLTINTFLAGRDEPGV